MPVSRALPVWSGSPPAEREPLAQRLAALTVPGTLVVPGAREGDLRCTACAHRCVLVEGRTGACGVRFQRDGVLRVPHGYVARSYVRPVETNTIYHVRPGASALTFGMFGCDLRCPYCHNWRVSQALREGLEEDAPTPISAEMLVEQAVAEGCEVLCAAYNEPMIAAEWVRDVFTVAKARGLLTAIISDANTTPEALAYVRPVTDVLRVDLKAFDEAGYRKLGGRLAPVLDGIVAAKALGFWVEVVTLVVPGLNDQRAGLRELGRTLLRIDPDMPWHLNAFVPRYRLQQAMPTSALTVMNLAGMAYNLGLRYVYAGNVSNEMRALEDTRCPSCHAVMVERKDYRTLRSALHRDGACSACGTTLAGLWSQPEPPRSRAASSAVQPV